MTPWDNPTVDALLFALVVLTVAALTIKWGPRLVRRDDDLHPPVSEPIRHVHVAEPPPSEMEDALHLSIYDTYRGQLGHSGFCRSGDGQELTCECEVAS